MTAPADEIWLQFALDATWQAGRITLGYFQTQLAAERKADNSMVTIADKQAEQRLRQLIQDRWPDHGIIGEEFDNIREEATYRWLIDPIDGTRSFVSGVPLYSTLLALLDGDRPLLGVIHLPALNETVYAVRGRGCYWNGRRVQTSSINKLEDAVVLISGLDHFTNPHQTQAWQHLVDATYAQRTWGDAYGYALVATGRAEIMVDPAMHLWDCGPLQVILEEAGGTFTDWQGDATIHAGESIATNGALYEQVMQRVKA
jgi:histidinol-phosphatase